MANVKLHVAGMHCGNCQSKVERALKGVGGVYSAVVDLEDGAAEIDFDDDVVTPSDLVAAIAGAGYAATLAG
jgi:copper chaperone CopZ